MFTPGFWKREGQGVVASSGEVICAGVSAGNAALIVAAPAMYERLRKLNEASHSEETARILSSVDFGTPLATIGS